MKKIVFVTCLFFISFASFAQRVVDLSINMTSPANNATISGTQNFNFEATVTNNGPDTLKTTDTLVLGFILDNGSSTTNVVINGQTYSSLGLVLQQSLATGASGNLNFTMALASAPSAGQHTLCVITIPSNRSADSVKDNNTINNQACASITVPSTSSVPNVAINNGGIVESVYPNPANTATTIGVNLSAAQKVSVTLTDISGRVMLLENKGTVPGGKSELRIDTGNLPAGVYLYQLNAGDAKSHGRLVISH